MMRTNEREAPASGEPCLRKLNSVNDAISSVAHRLIKG